MNLLVIDTNIPLLDARNIVSLGQTSIVCIPETVVDELDSFKSGRSELAYQSRSFGRLISAAAPEGRHSVGNLVITKFLVETAHIWVVSLKEYPTFEHVAPNILNDRKIIETAVQLRSVPDCTVTFMSNDVMCRIRAEAFGLTTKDFKVVEKVEYEFTKTLELDDETFRNVHNRNVYEVDPDHTIEHYNYKFTTPNSNQIKLATVNNETITVLGRDSEEALRKQDVNPANADQLLLSRAIQDPTMDLIVSVAKAGSGKTLIALSNAIKLVKDKTTPYTSIIYVRSSINDVEEVEEVGFLPGTSEDKNAVYFHPLYDSLDHIARSRFRDPKAGKVAGVDFEQKVAEHIEKIIKDNHIMPMTGLGMRGRTFKDCVFIYDEVQNSSRPMLQKALTRVGKNCKVILIGSNNQIDNPNMTKFTNGLSVILHDCATKTGRVNKHVVPLERVVRSAFAEYAEDLFTKEQND